MSFPKVELQNKLRFQTFLESNIELTAINSQNAIFETFIFGSITSMVPDPMPFVDFSSPTTSTPMILGTPLLTESAAPMAAGSCAGGQSFTLLPVEGEREFTEIVGAIEFRVLAEPCQTFSHLPSLSHVRTRPTIHWRWRRIGADNWTRSYSHAAFLMLSPSILGASGHYEMCASTVEAEGDCQDASAAHFQFILRGIPRPTALLAAPASASPDCGLLLDASASSDPSGADLVYTWACAEGSPASCEGAVEECNGAFCFVAANLLEDGEYVFILKATRLAPHAEDVTNATVEMQGKPRLAMSIEEPPQKVSGDVPWELRVTSATNMTDGNCSAPSWHKWCLVPVHPDVGGPRWLQNASGPRMTLQIHPSLKSFGAMTGRYAVRLALSNHKDMGCHSDTMFDSSEFEVIAGPAHGHCMVEPFHGKVLRTSFQISSLNWTFDNDHPLLHRFSQGSCKDSSSRSWFSGWSYASSIKNRVFQEAGNQSLCAEVRDSLGSVSFAPGTVRVSLSDTPPSEMELLGMLDSVTSTGDPFAILLGVAALAAERSMQLRNGSDSFQLDFGLAASVNSSGALQQPSIEILHAAALALRRATILLADVDEAQPAAAVDWQRAAADDVAEMVASIAIASHALHGGLQSEMMMMGTSDFVSFLFVRP